MPTGLYNHCARWQIENMNGPRLKRAPILFMLLACGPGKEMTESIGRTQSGGTSMSGDTASADPTLGTDVAPTTTVGGESTGTTTGAMDTDTSADGTNSSTGPAESTGGASTESSGESSTGTSVEGANVDGGCTNDNEWTVIFKLALTSTDCVNDPPNEILWAMIQQAGPLPPGTYPLGEGLGHALHQINQPFSSVFATVGEVVIEAWDDAAISGTYHFVFEDASERAGAFSGPLCSSLVPACD